MFTIPNTLTITDFRRKSAQILQRLPQEKLYLLIQNSKAKGAVIDLDYLKTLQQAYEDYLDIQEFDKRAKEPTISWEKYLAQSQKTR